LDLHPTSIDLVLKEVVNTYSRVASTKNVILWYHLDARIASAYIADSLRLSQILNNFVSNALKFTKDGEVEIRATLLKKLDGKDRIQFSVKDTGIGISKKNQEKLFQVYQQENADTARMYGGTGLGLAICLKLSKLMGGEISLESEMDQGSTFSIVLELLISDKIGENIRHSHPEVEQRKVVPIFGGDSESPLILAVDDHPTNRDLIGKQLKLLGLRVELAESGVDALEKWKTRKFDLIITDCHMPTMDGYELTRYIRKYEIEKKLKPVLIIAWTANILAEERFRCENAGMNDLLTKPANLELLRTILSKWLTNNKNISLEANNSSKSSENSKQALPIDIEILNKVVVDQTMQLQVLTEFYAQVELDHNKFINFFVTGEIEKAREMLHRIKGASMMVGATILSNICLVIENALIEKKLEEATQLMVKLSDAIIQVEAYILKLKLRVNK
jgi:two-component system sensor histidine kinase EvgS